MATAGARTKQETIFFRTFRLFKQKVGAQFSKVNQWRRDGGEAVGDFFGGITEWMLECKWGLIITLAIFVWLGLMIWFITDAVHGKVEGSAVQVGVGGLIGGAIMGLIMSPLAGGAAFLVLLLLNLLLRLLVAALLFPPLFIWTPLYAAWRAVFLMFQLLALFPLFLLFLVTRSVQLCKGIFWTCPGRGCSYRGLPAYVCPECGEANDRLWPNLYGVLFHSCIRCGHALPTLTSRGRNALERHCGNPQCRMPLSGKHAGKAPERLVGIVGGSTSGKTNYMLMAVNEIINGKSNLRGQIDESDQEERFKQDWERLSRGLVIDATVEVMKAFLLYVKMGGIRSQLYLYDAPGEEFESLAGMSKQQYFPLLDGFILTVDPAAFPAVRQQENLEGLGPTPLDDVVSSTLMRATTEAPLNRHGKVDMRVAVVISKADLSAVRERIGDIRTGTVDSAACRKAISEWGGANAIQGIENRFASVDYFACSALGRDPDESGGEAFKGYGVMPPLEWVFKR